MKLLTLVALTLLMPLNACHDQGTCTSGNKARVRDELAAEYAKFRAAFIKNVPQAWINALDSSFTLTLFNGAVMPRDWVEGYVCTNATQFHIRWLRMDIQSINVQADTALATVQQTSDRVFTDEHGGAHRLEVGARQLETWVCTSAGWRLRHVKEDSVLYLRRDSKPPS
jgi:hypothetical protein